MNMTISRTFIGFMALILLIAGVTAGAKAQQKASDLMASQVIDRDVYDADQKLIGEVDDIILRRNGKAKKLTVEYGGVLDLGDRLVALPFKGFSMRDERLTLDATVQQLEKKPEYNYYENGLRLNYNYAGRSGRRPDYYGHRPYGPYPYSPMDTYYHGPHMRGGMAGRFEWAYSPALFLASAILDRRLINEQGREIGRIQDLVINRDNNMVDKIIIFSEDILGEEVHVALDYKPLGFTIYGMVYDIMPGDLKEYVYPYKE